MRERGDAAGGGSVSVFEVWEVPSGRDLGRAGPFKQDEEKIRGDANN